MQRKLILLVAALICAVLCSQSCALEFPVKGDEHWMHLEGSSWHIFKNTRGSNGEYTGDRSDLFALDLNLTRNESGTEVCPVANGVVESVNDNFGFVVIRHNASDTPISTSSELINSHVNNTWYSGYMHMNLFNSNGGRYVKAGDEVTSDTVIGTISDVGIKGVVHLHFALYDEDMFSFSPYLADEVFREGKVTYKYDGGVSRPHYGDDGKASQEQADRRVLNKYTSSSTEAWYQEKYYENYRSNKNIDIAGEYTAISDGTYYSNLVSQTDSPLNLIDGYLNITGDKTGPNKEWLIIQGEVYFEGALLRHLSDNIITFNKKVTGSNSENILREYEAAVPEHIYYGSELDGLPYPYIHRAKETRYKLTQIDKDTLLWTVIHKYSEIHVMLKRNSASANKAVKANKINKADKAVKIGSGSIMQITEGVGADADEK